MVVYYCAIAAPSNVGRLRRLPGLHQSLSHLGINGASALWGAMQVKMKSKV